MHKIVETVEVNGLNVALSHEHRGGIEAKPVADWRPPELYAQIGGDEVVECLIDDFYGRLENDPRLAAFFPHFQTHAIKAFFIEWLGGEAAYSGSPWPHKGLDQFHRETYVTGSLAGFWLHHMRAALAESPIGEEIADLILDELGQIARSLVNSDDPPVSSEQLAKTCSGVHSLDFLDKDQLRKAAARGQLQTIQNAVAKDVSVASFRGADGRSLLWEAACRGKLELCVLLLDNGADPNSPGCDPSTINLACSASARLGTAVMVTPLAMALSRGYKKIADLLVSKGALADVFSGAFLGNLDILTVIARKAKQVIHAEDPAEDFKRITPLHHAVAGGRYDSVDWLISRGADVRSHSTWLLTHAALQNRADLVQLLLDNGADPQCAGVLGPLDLQERPVADLLVERGFDINSNPAYGAMLVRACRGDVSSSESGRVKTLLSYGADVNQPGHGGMTALHYATRAGRLEVVQLLIENGANVNCVDDDGLTPLEHLRKTRANIEPIPVMDLLLKHGADINKENKKGETLLFHFTRRGDANVVLWMLENGARAESSSGKNVISSIHRKKGDQFDLIRRFLENC